MWQNMCAIGCENKLFKCTVLTICVDCSIFCYATLFAGFIFRKSKKRSTASKFCKLLARAVF